MGPKTNFSTFSKEIRNLPPKASGANYASKEISAPNQPKPFPHSRLRSSAPGMLLAQDRTAPACARLVPLFLVSYQDVFRGWLGRSPPAPPLSLDRRPGSYLVTRK